MSSIRESLQSGLKYSKGSEKEEIKDLLKKKGKSFFVACMEKSKSSRNSFSDMKMVFDNVVEERINGDKATLTVKTSEGFEKKVVMVKEGLS